MDKEQGFTLIELLVVVAIIGVVAIIAMPNISSYWARSYDALVISDVKNIAAAQEAHFIDYESYATNIFRLAGFVSVSKGTFVLTQGNSYGLPYWIVVAGHPSASKIFCYSNISDQQKVVSDDPTSGDCVSLLTHNGDPIL